MSMKCLKTNPCKHKITITYEDDEQVEKTLDSSSIAKKYWNFLSRNDQNHLLCNPNVFESKIKQ